MNTLNITWLYPDLLNLHGDRGNLMAFERVGKAMGLFESKKYKNGKKKID